MTILQLHALCFYMDQTPGRIFPNIHRSIVREQVEELATNGLLDYRAERASYSLTEKGLAHLEHLSNIGLPVQQWVHPK